MQRFSYPIILLFLLLLPFLLAACSNRSPDNPLLGRRVMVWHSWDEDDSQELNKLLDQFSHSHNVTVIRRASSAATLFEVFLIESQLGLGPDLLIGSSEWVSELADEGLITDLSQKEEIEEITSIYRANAVDTLYYNEGLYGLPLSLHTTALYYNKQMVDTPPDTLDKLLLEAANGQQVALDTDFEQAFWGVQAFGGKLFDETQPERIVLDEGGFANWLDWLKNAQNQANMILDDDEMTLLNLFKEGKVAYYIGSSTHLAEVQESLGKEVVGVAALPKGPNGPAGPFLTSEGLMLSTKSSPGQAQLALELAQFLTKVPQQSKLARTTGRIPAHLTVRIDSQVYPAVAGFLAQSKTAVARPNLAQLDDLYQRGNQAYLQALANEQGSQQAAAELTEEMNDNDNHDTNNEAEPEPPPVTADSSCPTAQIEVWHTWGEREVEALKQIRDKFIARCPPASQAEISIEFVSQPRWFGLVEAYKKALNAGNAPDLLIALDSATHELASEGLIHDFNDKVPDDFWQRYVPKAQTALSYQEKMYGLPISMRVMALYYNKQWVSEPARDINDLLNQATIEHPVILPVTIFEDAIWGLAAFGGELFDLEGRLVVNENNEPFAEWLSWLQEVNELPSFLLVDHDEGKKLFAEGEAAYLAGSHDVLNELQQTLGKENLGVVPLPAAKNEAGPLLEVDGLMLSGAGEQKQRDLAFEFANYLASVESQTLLMEQANLVPANVNVDTSQQPAIKGFLDQSKTAIYPPINDLSKTFVDWGDFIYRHVLINELEPTEALSGFIKFVNDVHNNRVGGTSEEKESVVCEEEGQLLFWHSWDETQNEILTPIFTEFASICPKIKITTEFVPTDELSSRLAIAIKEGEAPDFFLTQHDQIAPLAEEGLIKPIRQWVTDSTLAQFLPWAIEPLYEQDQLYGLPKNLHTVALYINRSLVNQTPQTTDKLLAAATPETPVALDTTFYGAFWGISAFGGEEWKINTIIKQQNRPTEPPPGLIDWLAWLQAAQKQPGIILSQDQQQLQEQFATGQAAYLIAGTELLPSLQQAIESENLQVVPLPEGPNGIGKPFLAVSTFLFTSSARDEQTQLALIFAQFATSSSSQTLLTQRTDLLPANSAAFAALLNRKSELEPFAFQTLETVPLPSHANNVALLKLGDQLYRDVLGGNENQDAVPLVNKFIEEMDNLMSNQAAQPSNEEEEE